MDEESVASVTKPLDDDDEASMMVKFLITL